MFGTGPGASVQQLLPLHGPVPHHLRPDDPVHPGDGAGGGRCLPPPPPGQPGRHLRRAEHHEHPARNPRVHVPLGHRPRWDHAHQPHHVHRVQRGLYGPLLLLLHRHQESLSAAEWGQQGGQQPGGEHAHGRQEAHPSGILLGD